MIMKRSIRIMKTIIMKLLPLIAPRLSG